ncbi:MAG: virulence-associated E family protein, partial [Acidimicrobiia bacterium]|nr:virulence-associated E family protein [Acidimicrobiia bacterium]
EIERVHRRDWSAKAVNEALQRVAGERAYHPILDRLDALEWDGTPRLDTWLIDHAEAPDNEYVRQASRKLLVAAVARLRRPGCKWDHMLLLHGSQGAGKSTLCRDLALDDRWFAELRSVDPKVAAETIGGVWIVEMCELEAFDRSEISTLKAFVTIQTDRYRPAYGRNVEVRPRSCVVIGTTNEVEVLRDATGNRRFWPVHVGEIDTEGLRAVVEQLYAEADVLYGLGESLWLEGDAVELAKAEQESHRQTDPWEERIATWLSQPVSPDRYDGQGEAMFGEGSAERDRVCVQEILDDCLSIQVRDQHSGVRRRIGTIMRRMEGWDGPKSIRFGVRYGVQRGWERIPF